LFYFIELIVQSVQVTLPCQGEVWLITCVATT
jgi:hypothetical protein